MVSEALPFTLKLVLFIYRLLLKLHKNYRRSLQRSFSNSHASDDDQFRSRADQTQRPFSQAQTATDLIPEKSTTLIIFDVEGTLLRSSSVFPYFMLVAFEAGSIIRAFLLFILYPLLCLVSQQVSLKIMVMVCFFGVKRDSFRVGTAVLPKFFLEDVGVEGTFQVLKKLGGGRKTSVVAVSSLPHVMVDSFLKDYLEIDHVVGRDLKVCCGYFVGLMENKDKNKNVVHHLKEVFTDDKINMCSNSIGIIYSSNNHKSIITHQQYCFSNCKDVYVVSEGDKMRWQSLPRERYPKPLIFHDGRLSFRPDPLPILTMFMWFPFGLTLSVIRCIIALSLPYGASIPILSFSGMQLKQTKPSFCFDDTSESTSSKAGHKGLLYVCNHRTLLDPLFLSFGLKKPFAAVTYSLSRMSEILSPIKTIRLTRDRDQDAKMMDKLLKQGDLVVCPEGTTCREPYLLRFSPLFAELSDHIVPVALDTHVTMFYGTTASGLKCLDPFFFLMNPCPLYTIRFLDKVRGASTLYGHDDHEIGSKGLVSRFDVANYVQSEVGKALSFTCTGLTRKDKYLILAGNEGLVSACN